MNMLSYPTSPQSYLTLCDPMVVAHQALLSMGFCKQEYWSGLPCPPPPGDLHNPVIKPVSPALQAEFPEDFYGEWFPPLIAETEEDLCAM